MVTTRSATSSPVKKSATTVPTAKSTTRQDEGLKQFILPKNTCPDARFLLLRHPRKDARTRFLFCPQTGLYDFTTIATSSADPRSVLYTPNHAQSPAQAPRQSEEPKTPEAYISKDAALYIATPFDVSFLLLNILLPSSSQSTKALFQPLDDLLEASLDGEKHWRYLVTHGRAILEAAAERVCDTLEAGDEKMYRVNEDKILDLVIQKAQQAIAKGLPKSLEEKFVTRALEAPVLSLKREESSISIASEGGSIAAPSDDVAEGFDSQSTTASSAASAVFSEACSTSTEMTTVEDTTPTDVKHLQRLRTAFNFITSSFVSTHIAEQLQEKLASNKTAIDFTPLETHLKHLAALRADAVASRSLSDFSRKRGLDDDEEMMESRAEKKRKQEEEEKRQKAGVSRGVRDLKKVNVTGMKKMSAFFKPATAKAKT